MTLDRLITEMERTDGRFNAPKAYMLLRNMISEVRRQEYTAGYEAAKFNYRKRKKRAVTGKYRGRHE